MSHVLVIGGQGFIGSHVCDSLVSHGHRIRIISRNPSRTDYKIPSAEYLYFDYGNKDKLEDALKGIDCVIHLASSVVPSSSNLDPVTDIESNLVSTVALFDLMRGVGLKKIIYMSSGGTVYGNPHHVPITESHPLNPICSYGITKVAVEKYLLMYQYLYGFQPIILRPSNPYGPRQGHTGAQGLINTFLNQTLAGESLNVWGDGEVVRDHFYVEDLANLCALAIKLETTGIFNIGSGKGTSINEIIKIIRSVTKIDTGVVYNESRNFDVSQNYLDISSASANLDWSPSMALSHGIAKHWSWIKSVSK